MKYCVVEGLQGRAIKTKNKEHIKDGWGKLHQERGVWNKD